MYTKKLVAKRPLKFPLVLAAFLVAAFASACGDDPTGPGDGTWVVVSSFTDTTNSDTVSGVGTTDKAITFTSDVSGTVERVAIYASASDGLSMTVDLRSTTAGAPNEDDVNVLASRTVTYRDRGMGSQWIVVDFDGGPRVTSGETLAIALRSTDGGWGILGKTGDPAAESTQYFRNPGRGINDWAVITQSDLFYRVHVKPE